MKFAAGMLCLGLLGPLGIFGPCVVGAGVDDYREARFAAALEAFSQAEEQAGTAAGAPLVFNRALAALQAGDLRTAEFSAEKALVRGGEDFEGLRRFLFANVAMRRSLRAEAEADLRDADPTAFTRAIAHVEEAIVLWKDLVLRRRDPQGDWPAARRNLERALRKRAELEAKREEAEAKQNTKKERDQQEQPEEQPEDVETTPEEQEDKATPQTQLDLSSVELAQLFEQLRELELEKRKLRQERQRVRSRNVEKDW